MLFQDIISGLGEFWKKEGCFIGVSYPGDVGAGTFNPLTFFSVFGKKPVRVGYVEASKRPKDGRYAENPNRLQSFYQYQVILKPAPSNIQELYLYSLSSLGIDIKSHDIRFVEDDWEQETLGAYGLGWEVWLDGMEITQFTYFQRMAGIELEPISVELTYGLERICMLLQGKDSVYDIAWSREVKYGELFKKREEEFSRFNFDEADIEMLRDDFKRYEKEAARLLGLGLLFPAYDYCLKCSHILNLLDARRALSPGERKNMITRVRKLIEKVGREVSF
ncbi:glycine--tRNA ligase subunit alpha [candidate division WOR-3 bacterium]|nr:glycine--tRNA ligase subunit alpha [candidate division WOR-3 bacterium]